MHSHQITLGIIFTKPYNRTRGGGCKKYVKMFTFGPNQCKNYYASKIENYLYVIDKFFNILYKEKRINIRGEFTRKKWKTAILLYCFHTAGVLHIFMLYKLLGPGISFYRKSKIIVKRKPNYEIGWFYH